jgi:hypothetical protein
MTDLMLKELKAKIDLDAGWFKTLMFRDLDDDLDDRDKNIPVEISQNELIDRTVEFVQNKILYFDTYPIGDRKLIMNVFKFSRRLQADFFEETKRILSNAARCPNPILEFEGELTNCNYHFEYAGNGFFYYVEYMQDGKRRIAHTVIVNAVATFGDWHSPFFQTLFIKQATEPLESPVYEESSYQLILKSYLHRWLRWQIQYRKGEPQTDKQRLNSEQKFKPIINKTPIIPTTLEELLADANDFPMIIEAMQAIESINSECECINLENRKGAFAALYAVLVKKNYMNSAHMTRGARIKVNCFENTFKGLNLTDKTLINKDIDKTEFYKELDKIIPLKKK